MYRRQEPEQDRTAHEKKARWKVQAISRITSSAPPLARQECAVHANRERWTRTCETRAGRLAMIATLSHDPLNPPPFLLST